MPDNKTCFIIMPITTPESMIEKYRDGEEHFSHVLESLFIPSIVDAGFEPIRPIAEGAEVIHARIIDNLLTADIVLCDMSCLNPNVFFELGVRTALNKPVCLVKDEMVDRLPFDTGIINCYEYKKDLNGWELDDHKISLISHLKKSYENSNEQNTLWKLLGFKASARLSEGGTMENKVDMLLLSVESLSSKFLKLSDDMERTKLLKS